jgi:hypothetical protein
MRKISTCKLCLVRTAGCRYGEPDQDYETDSNANKKSSKVELEEWIDGDYENQVFFSVSAMLLRDNNRASH